MNCRDARRHISAERDDPLNHNQRAALDQHATECADCRRLRTELALALNSWRVTLQQTPVPDSTKEWEALRRTIRAGTKSPVERRRHLMRWLALPIGAAAAAVLALWVNPAPSPSNGPAVAVARATDAVEVSAADGSVVFVDDKSGWVVIWEAPPPAHSI